MFPTCNACRPRGFRLLTLALATAAPLLTNTACDKTGTSAPEETDAVDKLAAQLLTELSQADREGVVALTTQTAAAALDEREIAVIARTLDWLGAFELLAQSEEAVVGGIKRRYLARFDRGDLGLELTVVGDKIEGFAFDEGSWTKLSEQALEAAAGSLAIATFEFTGPEGEVIPQPQNPAAIGYAIELEGLGSQLREHHVTIDKQVFDAEGNLVYRQDTPDEIRFPQAESGSSGGRLTGSIAVPGPGRYEIELRVDDMIAGQQATHRQVFQVVAAPPP